MAYLEAGLLECCCVSWMPSAKTIDVLKSFRRLRPLAQRLERRQFPALSQVPKVQDRVREIYRLLMRALALRTYPPDYVNRWLMRTMVRECCRSTVTTVHAYEDCSLWPFIKAKRLNKACVYDLPSPFYPPWEIQVELSRKYSDWMPSNCWPAAYDLTLQQKLELTLVGSWGLGREQTAVPTCRYTWIPQCSPQFLRDQYRSPTCPFFHRILMALDWFCSRLWRVVCPPSRPRRVLAQRS